MVRKDVFSLIVCLLAASPALAQPRIDRIEGNWAPGSTITLFGQFPTKSTAQPLRWDTLDNQPGYESRSVGHGNIIPSTSGDWGIAPCPDCPWDINQPDWSSPMRYWDQDHRTSARPFYRVEEKGWFRLDDLGDSSPNQIYMSWWFRTSAPDLTLGSNKLVRLWADTERAEGSMSWTGMHFTYTPDANHDGVNDAGDTHDIIWGSWGGSQDSWHHLELIYDGTGDVNHGFGSVRIVRDGRVVHEAHDAYGIMPWNRLYVFGFDASVSSNFTGETFDFSEIYIDTSLSRVVAANAPRYRDATHMEMQIPVSWTEDHIELTSNIGSFGSLEDVWIYVFDQEGLVNEVGFSLTAPDAGPPGQPGQPVIQ